MPTLCQCGCGEPATYAASHVKRSLDRSLKFNQWAERDMGFETPCHVWIGAMTKSATGRKYGRVWFAGKYRRAHRVIWELEHGPLAPTMQIHHLCGIKECVNLAHLMPLDSVGHARADRAKLDPERVRYIRSAEKSVPIVARELGVSESLVYAVRAGGLWTDVD